MRKPHWSGWTYDDAVTATLGKTQLEVGRNFRDTQWRWVAHGATSGWRHVIDWGGSDSLAGAQAEALRAARSAK